MTKKDGIYTFDWDKMEAEIDEDVTTFVLCNSHNPVGRVFERDELERLSKFIVDHDLFLISDEIHSQLILEGNHIPVFTVSEELKERSITFTSASKTYNIAAIPFAFAIIPNKKIRAGYKEIAYGLFQTPNALTMEAIEAAYTKCDDWRNELIEYLRGNRDYLEDRIAKIDGLSINHNQGTYLAWIDATELGLENPWEFFREKAGVNFSNGADFGDKNYLRVNFACPRDQLVEAFDKVEIAIKAIKNK